MKLAKQHLDIGVYVRDTEPALRFWQDEVGAKFDECSLKTSQRARGLLTVCS